MQGAVALRRLTAPVSVLFNEPKLLKFNTSSTKSARNRGFSALERAEIAEIPPQRRVLLEQFRVSVLFNEPKLLK